MSRKLCVQITLGEKKGEIVFNADEKITIRDTGKVFIDDEVKQEKFYEGTKLTIKEGVVTSYSPRMIVIEKSTYEGNKTEFQIKELVFTKPASK